MLKKGCLGLLAALALLAGVGYVERNQVFAGVGEFLVIRDQLIPSDILYLLNGDPIVRPARAAELFHKGMAPRVVIARVEDSVDVQLGVYPNTTDTNIGMLEKLGVPESRIVQLRPAGGVKHTFDEAEALLQYYRQSPFQRVIIVTSDIHSRRARFIFKKVFSGIPVKIMMATIPDKKYGAENWWHLEDGVIGLQNEYLKLLYYHLKY